MSEKQLTCIFSMARCGKTIRIQQEYEKAENDGKKVLFVDKEQLEKELLGAETPFDKLYKKYLKKWEKEMNKRYSDKRRVITRRFK